MVRKKLLRKLDASALFIENKYNIILLLEIHMATHHSKLSQSYYIIYKCMSALRYLVLYCQFIYIVYSSQHNICIRLRFSCTPICKYTELEKARWMSLPYSSFRFFLSSHAFGKQAIAINSVALWSLAHTCQSDSFEQQFLYGLRIGVWIPNGNMLIAFAVLICVQEYILVHQQWIYYVVSE